MTQNTDSIQTVSADLGGLRLDQAAAQLFPEYSRARLQQWIKDGDLKLNGQTAKAKDKVIGGELLSLHAHVEHNEQHQAENLLLNIVHEDAALLIINKPVGMVVHPAAGNHSGTLLNGLLAHCPALAGMPRAGIVHRLDKDTSGLMVVAKTPESHHYLVSQLQERTMGRHYEAVVQGVLTAGGTVNAPIGRHPVQRQKRAVSDGEGARDAVTHFRVKVRFRSHTYISVQLETGRTHQIRVHMAHLGHPVVGDQVYGGRLKPPRGAAPQLLAFLQQFKRQALHARTLGFNHPDTDEFMQWEAPLPDDMLALLTLLEQDLE
ncbi:MAG: 23S rRNA pseudouridine(1911/1915/1917) synthase RluD [Pseudohongiellaceae bacterium]